MKKKKSYMSFINVIFLCFAFVLIAVSIWVYHALSVEKICSQKVSELIKQNGDRLLSREETKKYVTDADQIYWGYAQEIQCNREHTYLGVF